jgi:hypothetical protein
MTKRSASLMSTFVLLVGIVACAGSAFAANGNGEGSPPASPGNSANAPGQVKKTTATTSSSGGGGGSVDQNSVSTTGVKPTSGTSHDTHCTTTGAGCTSTGPNATTMGAGDASKRYGNGKTAAQVATANDAPAGTDLHGPGNSQPHKAALCPGGHEVDVHALKAKGQQKSCVTSGPTSTTSVTTSHAATISVTGGAAVMTPTAAGAAPAAQVTTPQGNVLGVTTSQGKPAGGVLGAIAAVGQGALPFTGFPLWAAVLGAVALFAFGLGLRHLGRATA